MIKRFVIVAGLMGLLLGLAYFALPQAQKKIDQGDQALAFQLPDLQGKLQSLPKGEVILLNFWATWCPPCRQEMPSMVRLYQKYQTQGLKVVAVSVDKDASALAKFVGEYHLPFTVLHDQKGIASTSYGVFRYPESFLIDRQGKVQAHIIGAVEWMSAKMQKDIQTLLQGQPLIAAE